MSIPLAPETDTMIIAIFDDGVVETLGSIEIDGRGGLICWYLSNVGYSPDKEPDGPLPIMQFCRIKQNSPKLTTIGSADSEKSSYMSYVKSA